MKLGVESVEHADTTPVTQRHVVVIGTRDGDSVSKSPRGPTEESESQSNAAAHKSTSDCETDEMWTRV
jgi:hypothetical protein